MFSRFLFLLETLKLLAGFSIFRKVGKKSSITSTVLSEDVKFKWLFHDINLHVEKFSFDIYSALP